MKKIIYSLCGVLVLAVLSNWLFPTINSGKDLPRLVQPELLSQKEDQYFLYFYYEECPLCLQLDPLIAEASKEGFPIYAVDMKQEQNMGIWYDWVSHHEQYDVEIGTVTNGVETLYEGITRDHYLGEEWEIEAVDGKLIASHVKAYVNENPTTIGEIQVAGTPTLMHVANGTVKSTAQGLIQCQNMLNDFIKVGLSAFEAPEAPVESELVLDVIED